MKKHLRVRSKIRQNQEQRGTFAEERVYQAACSLRDRYGVLARVTRTEKWDSRDRRGMDIIVRGRDPLHAFFSIDVKNSSAGVNAFYRERSRKSALGEQNPIPGYAFLFGHESMQHLELKLLRFVFENSKNYKHAAELVPEYDHIAGPDFRERLKYFIASVFS
ncbi:MAG: hypothetical protein WDZ39_00985 [Candidatus Spechtbacterales bacterium]